MKQRDKEHKEIRELINKIGFDFDKFRLIRILKNTEGVLIAQLDNNTYTIDKTIGRIVAIEKSREDL